MLLYCDANPRHEIRLNDALVGDNCGCEPLNNGSFIVWRNLMEAVRTEERADNAQTAKEEEEE